MPTKHVSLATLALTLPLLCAGAAQADSAAETAPPPAMAGHFLKLTPAQRAAWHQDHCLDRFAHEKARLTYLETRLALTPQQESAWRKLAAVRLKSAEGQRDACLAEQPAGTTPPSVVARAKHLQARLSARLTALETAQPPLQALYDQLDTHQRAILDRPVFHEGFGPREGFGHPDFPHHHPEFGPDGGEQP
ncbi:hypothetical protein GALL_87430 [mine drainage metagenome]|uniref:LTXXQ motif family protein n=1 Tax=mine drainage metagenome TaxID=410659 RepID=A0A1J5SYM3_9ZZZZ